MSPPTSRVGENREHLVRRVRVLTILLGLLLVVVAAGFLSVQLVHGAGYRDLAETNRLRKQPVEALRGQIFDRRQRPLVENVPSYNLILDRSRAADPAASLTFAAHTLGRDPQELEQLLERYRSVPSFRPVLLAENLSLEEVARFEVAGFEHPEFQIEVRHLRLYRYGPQMAHVLGYLGEVTEEELVAADGRYEGGDLVGRLGLEQQHDDRLRGADGERVAVVDSRGKLVEEFGRRPAAAGDDLGLTLDLELQQTAVELLEGQRGAIVALDPETGAIAAMASAPSFDPNLFSRRLQREEWAEILEAEGDPLQNRAIQNVYSPGSVFKIVLGFAGLAERVVTPKERVWCAGSTVIYNHRFRCWRRAGHGWVDLAEAIQSSCDVYFYYLGQKLGIDRIAHHARRFALGEPTGIDIRGERDGLVPDSAWSLRARKAPWFPGETISVSIGQGPLVTTPLQVARMVAVVANGGRLVVPHLSKDFEAPAGRDVELDPAAMAVVRRALWGVVNDPEGTGRQARLATLDVAGKTGTVQVVAQRTWTDTRELPFHKRDHAWFAAYAPAEAPRLVVVVFVEHGGRGSEVAAPLARAMYEKYFEIESDRHRPV